MFESISVESEILSIILILLSKEVNMARNEKDFVMVTKIDFN